MRIKFFMLIAVSLILLGCSTSFHEIKPIYPVVGAPYRQKVVDTLQPTFRWESLQEHYITYDLIIYEGIKVESKWWQGSTWTEGREVYYRQALKEPEHKIEEPLKPDTVYYWTIRARLGEKVSAWVSYDYFEWGPYFGSLSLNNNHFNFKTPKNKGAE